MACGMDVYNIEEYMLCVPKILCSLASLAGLSSFENPRVKLPCHQAPQLRFRRLGQIAPSRRGPFGLRGSEMVARNARDFKLS